MDLELVLATLQYRTLLQVSAALGVPYAYLSNDMLKANYSNSRLALLEFRRRIEAYQHAVIVWQLGRRVWARWMDTAVLAGALESGFTISAGASTWPVAGSRQSGTGLTR
jgi:capsid protein